VANDVLIVDDESDIQSLVGGILEDEGYACRKAGDSDTALAALHARQPNVVILDVWLQGSRIDGLELLRIVKRDHPLVPVVMISGHGTIETAVAAIKEGAYDFIEKPFKADRLVLMVGRAIEQARLLRENVELRMRVGGEIELIGVSAIINQLRQSIQRVAPTGSRVLITGPAGSGKEVVARLIHAGSHRAEGPFAVVNCAAMRPELMETVLFGTEPDASDEQAPRKIGTFEQAHGGTLFLDEVSDMPFETQGKIVRVLQEQTFERVGGATRVEVDVRVMASSHKDLAVEMAEGRFREDLFYRLNVVPIRVPALNERKGDIPVLAEHFITQAAARTGRPPRRLGDDALAAFQSYEWPGNVRQLENAIDWLLIMAPGEADEPIRADMLPPEIGAITPETLKGESGGEFMSLPLREARETFEREYLLAQVTRFGGNISRTAAFVGMERTALHRKLKALGLYDIDKPSLRG
jgi:two-component system nitrogen regulation response regulator NtrX